MKISLNELRKLIKESINEVAAERSKKPLKEAIEVRSFRPVAIETGFACNNCDDTGMKFCGCSGRNRSCPMCHGAGEVSCGCR
jgi:DnaJ-class molecular chaperone